MAQKKSSIRIPAHYVPRPEQVEFWKAYHNGIRFFDLCWHRREGKDITALNATVEEILTKRPGLAWHLFPTLAQGRKVLWDATDNVGRPLTSAFPKELVTEVNKADMRIKCKYVPDIVAGAEEIRESTWQIVGADNPDSLRGANPILVVISEFGDIAPNVWYEIIQPILFANGGKAIFVWTPKGRNHAYTLHCAAQESMNNPDVPAEFKWFSQELTVRDTHKWVYESGEEAGIPSQELIDSGVVKCVSVVSEDAVNEARKQGMDEAKIQQEFYVSFDAALKGAYFGDQMNEAVRDGRINNIVLHNPAYPVFTGWDLGMNDTMDIVFAQIIDDQINIIDFYENNGKGLEHYIQYCQNKPYTYAYHFGPHDLRVRELGAGSRLEYARKLGMNFTVIPRVSAKEDSINAARAILNRCFFNMTKCHDLIESLKSYTKKWDEKRQCYLDTPLHNKFSNACLVAGTRIKMADGTEKNIEDIQPGDEVWISDTISAPVVNAGCTGIKETYLVTLTDGTVLELTGNHKIFTTRGLVRTDALQYNDHVDNIKEQLWTNLLSKSTKLRDDVISYGKMLSGGFGKIKDTTYHNAGAEADVRYYKENCSELQISEQEYTQRMETYETCHLKTLQQETLTVDAEAQEQTLLNTTANASMPTKDTGILKYMGSCTDTSGHSTMGLFQKGMQFITLTWTKVITVLRTCNVSPMLFIQSCMEKLTSGLEHKQIKTNSDKLEKKQNCGMRHQKGLRGTENMQSNVASVKATEKSKPVYNITVANHHCYYANGVLVSNCDAFQTLSMGLTVHPKAMKKMSLKKNEDDIYTLEKPDMSRADDSYDLYNFRSY